MTDERREPTITDLQRIALNAADVLDRFGRAYCEAMRPMIEALGKMAQNPGVQAAMKDIERRRAVLEDAERRRAAL